MTPEQLKLLAEARRRRRAKEEAGKVPQLPAQDPALQGASRFVVDDEPPIPLPPYDRDAVEQGIQEAAAIDERRQFEEFRRGAMSDPMLSMLKPEARLMAKATGSTELGGQSDETLDGYVARGTGVTKKPQFRPRPPETIDPLAPRMPNRANAANPITDAVRQSQAEAGTNWAAEKDAENLARERAKIPFIGFSDAIKNEAAQWERGFGETFNRGLDLVDPDRRAGKFLTGTSQFAGDIGADVLAPLNGRVPGAEDAGRFLAGGAQEFLGTALKDPGQAAGEANQMLNPFVPLTEGYNQIVDASGDLIDGVQPDTLQKFAQGGTNVLIGGMGVIPGGSMTVDAMRAMSRAGKTAEAAQFSRVANAADDVRPSGLPPPSPKPSRTKKADDGSFKNYSVSTEDAGDLSIDMKRYEDGSVVIMDDKSTFKYPAEFANGKTDEELLAYSYEPQGYKGTSKAEAPAQPAPPQEPPPPPEAPRTVIDEEPDPLDAMVARSAPGAQNTPPPSAPAAAAAAATPPPNPRGPKDTREILANLIRSTKIPREHVEPLVQAALDGYERFKAAGGPAVERYRLGRYIDKHIADIVADAGVEISDTAQRDIRQAIRGRGRVAHGDGGPGDQSRAVMSKSIGELRASQKEWARRQIEARDAFNKTDLYGQKQAIKKTAEEIGNEVYGPTLDFAKKVWSGGRLKSLRAEEAATQNAIDQLTAMGDKADQTALASLNEKLQDIRKSADEAEATSAANPANPGELEAMEKLKNYLLRQPYMKSIPEDLKLRLSLDEIPLETRINEDPVGTAHWLQSKFGQSAADKSASGDKAMAGALGEARDRLLTELDKAAPAYEKVRADYGDEFRTLRAGEFGKGWFGDTLRPEDVAERAADYAKMTVREKTLARMSTRDEIMTVFEGGPEDSALKLAKLSQEGNLKALETVFGAPGKKVADTIREIRDEALWLNGDKDAGLQGIDSLAGSNSIPNVQNIRNDAAAIRNGLQKGATTLGDRASIWGAMLADAALMLGSHGVYSTPMMTLGVGGSKASGAVLNPSKRKMANATEGLFGGEPFRSVIDEVDDTVIGNAPKPDPKPKKPRAPKAALPDTMRELQEAYKASETKADRRRIGKKMRALQDAENKAKQEADAAANPREPDQMGFRLGGRKPAEPPVPKAPVAFKRDPALVNLSPGDMVAYIDKKYPPAGKNLPSPYYDAMTALQRSNGDRAAAAEELQRYADYLKSPKAKATAEQIENAQRTVNAVADVDPIFFDDAAFTASMKGKAEAGFETAMEQLKGGDPKPPTRQGFTPIIDNVKQDVGLAAAGSFMGSVGNQEDPQQGAAAGMAAVLGAKYAILAARAARAGSAGAKAAGRAGGVDMAAFGGATVAKAPKPSDLRISTRTPSTKKPAEDYLTEDLAIDQAAMEKRPESFAHNMELTKEYPGFKTDATDPHEVGVAFRNHVKDNLKWLWESTPEAVREKTRQWYVGANKIAAQMSKDFGIDTHQAAAVIAALSPQKAWDQNVSLAQRVAQIYKENQGFAGRNSPTQGWTRKMSGTGAVIFGKPQYRELMKSIKGKPFSELTDPTEKAMWVRIYDEAHNDRSYHIWSPEGTTVGEKGGIAAWGSLSEIAKAIKILDDGTVENISANMGQRHKVRNFYNNIVDPAGDIDVTIDTHAVAAALVRPLSGNTVEVAHNFGNNLPKGKQPDNWRAAKAVAETGASGMYGIYADAYREAAKELGILPRELQSVTWEAIRNLFRPTWKGNAKNVEDVNAIWKQYTDGEVSLEEARRAIVERAGGFDEAAWESGSTRRDGPDLGDDEEAWNSADASEVSGAKLPGGVSGSVDSGAGGRDAGAVQAPRARGRNAGAGLEATTAVPPTRKPAKFTPVIDKQGFSLKPETVRAIAKKARPVEARRPAPRGNKPFSDPRLSPGENKTAEMIQNGYTYEEIADEMMTSLDVVKKQASNAQKKLGADVQLPRPGQGKRPQGSTKKEAAFALFEEARARGERPDNDAIASRTGLSVGNVKTYKTEWSQKNNAPVASTDGAAYNPPAMPERPFEADYPQEDWPDGSPVDAQGRLTRDMDRRPLDQNSVIIGRNKAPGNGPKSEADRSLRDRIAVIQTLKESGSSLKRVPRSSDQTGGGWAPNFDASGRFTGRGSAQIVDDIDRPIAGLDDQEVITLSHELAHSIDFKGGPAALRARNVDDFNNRKWGIEHKNSHLPPESRAKLESQLERIYRDLNNPVDGEVTIRTPKDRGYEAIDADRELWAEAIRAYMYDPNYMKTVAPDVAFMIRDHVNRNRSLRKTIQFNAVPTVVGVGAAGAAALSGQREAEAQQSPYARAARTYKYAKN